MATDLVSQKKRHDSKTRAASRALCEGNAPVIGGFLSQGANDLELRRSFCCQLKQTFVQSVEFSVIWDAKMLMWRHLNEYDINGIPMEFLLKSLWSQDIK